jgi:translation initiation factor IF-2
MAKGLVIEARLDKGRGPVATVLVQSGTLRKGDVVLAGRPRAACAPCSTKTASRSRGRPVDPGRNPGSDRGAAGGRRLHGHDRRAPCARDRHLPCRASSATPSWPSSRPPSSRTCSTDIGEGEVKVLPIIIKADVQGSQEALAQSLLKLSTDEVKVQLVFAGGGWHQRERRQPGDRLQGGHHRLQRARRCGRAQAGRRQRRRHPLLQHHLRRRGRGEGGHVRHAGAREARRGHRLAEIRTVFVATKIGTVAGCMVTAGHVTRTRALPPAARERGHLHRRSSIRSSA